MKHKIYLIQATNKSDGGYDSFDSHVVIADTEEEARSMCPTGDQHTDDFTNPIYSDIKIIGISDEMKGIVISSFNAG